MLIPYTGEALKTYEKIHTLRIYEHNKLYPFKDTFYYINKKGYLHIFLLSALNFHGKKQFYISDQMLTKDNRLRECRGYNNLFDTKEAAIESLYKEVEQ